MHGFSHGPGKCKVTVIKKHGDECCDPNGHHVAHHGSECCHPNFQRHFIGKEEKIAHLEMYRDQLAKELAGVEESIECMGDKKSD